MLFCLMDPLNMKSEPRLWFKGRVCALSESENIKQMVAMNIELTQLR